MTDQPEITEVDFSQYKTRELLGEVTDLVDLPNTLIGIGKMVVLCLFVFGSVLWAVGEIKGLQSTVLYLLAVWSIVAGLVGGLFLGFAEFVRRSLAGISKIIRLLVRLTGRVVSDQRKVFQGTKQLPPPREMMRQCYEKVVLPGVEEVVKRRLSILGGIGFWVYRMSLGQAVRVAIRYVPIGFLERKAEVSAEELHSTFQANVVEREELQETFVAVEGKLDSIAGTITRAIVLPAYGIVGLILLFLSVPYAIIVFLM